MNTSTVRDAVARGIGRVGGRVVRSRTAMRAPLWIYRAHLGFVLGTRILMLEHVGRRSGLCRRVVLEVVERPDAHTFIVASALGDRAQWFRNVAANPDVRVSSGRFADAPARARVLPAEDAQRALRSYAARHQRAWRTLKPVIEHTLGAPVAESGASLPMVELRLDRGGLPCSGSPG